MVDAEILSKLEPDPQRVRAAVWRLESLPALSPAIQKALEMSTDPLCSNRDLDRVLSVDQAVVTALLRIANSAYYSLEGRITTVSRAVTVIGHAQLHSLLLQLLLAGVMRRLGKGRPEAKRILDFSLAAAAACRNVVDYSQSTDAEQLLVGGLLHNLGDLVLLSEFPKEYGAALRLAHTMPADEAQTTVLGVASPLVGRWLIECWGLPEMFAESTEHWKTPFEPDLEPAVRRFVTAVHVGAYLGRAWSQERGVEAAEADILPEALEQCALNGEIVGELYDHLSEEVAKAHLLLE